MMVAALSVVAQQVCRYRFADLLHLYAYRLYSTVLPKLNLPSNTSPQPASTALEGKPNTTRGGNATRGGNTTRGGYATRNKEKRNQQSHRAELGPQPQKRTIAKNPQRSSLSLLEAIKKDISESQPLSKVAKKIFFALSIPTTPPLLARELFQIALKYHIENNKIINDYLRIVSDAQDLDSVLEVFQYLKRIQQKPLVIQYGYILKCWTGPKNMDMAVLDKNFEQMKPVVPVERLEQIYAIYLSVYAHKKMYSKVDYIIERMRNEGVPITHITYSEILSALIKNDPSEEKINEVMLQMDKDNITPTRPICNSILGYYSKTGQIEKALMTAEKMEKHGVPFFEDSFMPLIDGFRKKRILNGVLYILNEMVSRKITLSRGVYTSVIAAYCELKDMETAIKVFETMKQSGTTPLAPTYNCLINGYLKMDDVQGALNILVKMKENNVPPDLQTYPHFIDHFRRKEDLVNALELIQQMRSENLPISHVTYYTVVSLAIRLHGYDEQAKGIIKQMIEERVFPNEYLFRAMLAGVCKWGFNNTIFEIFDLMDSLKAKYNQHQLTPVLETMLRLTPVRADLAWEVLRRAMLQRFDLKTLPSELKKELKQLGLMHPIENGEIKY